MEEMWKDINLSSLHGHLSSRDDQKRATTSYGMSFQNFLARPFSTDHPISTNFSPVQPPATMLTLNSGQELQVLEKSDPLKHTPFLENHQTSQRNLSFDPFNGKKRDPESGHNRNSSDKRHKKMIKNRESAARSRARKQAYTTELELELENLLKENARLKKQKDQLSFTVSAEQPKSYKLARASSATF